MILILTAGFGDGHNTAARNVAAGLARLAPDETVKVIDVVDEAHPVMGKFNKSAYQFLITRAPWLWKKVFDRAAHFTFHHHQPGMIYARLQRALDEIIKQEQPRAIVTTFLIYSGLLDNLRHAGRSIPPLFTVVTDSTVVHPMWHLGPSDRYFVADADSATSLASLGAKREAISVSGFPVSLDFNVPPASIPESPRGRILYLPSTGERHTRRTLDSLKPLLQDGTKLTLPLGKHYSRLYHVMTRFLDAVPEGSVEVLGWTDQIPRLLQTHDLVICKAGGAILHEALAACCPAIVDKIVPGQEQGNADMMVNLGGGVISQSPENTGVIARNLLFHDRAEARRMKQNMRAHAVPDAALQIAQEMLDHLKT